MRKKWLALGMSLVLAFSLTACGDSASDSDKKETVTEEATKAPETDTNETTDEADQSNESDESSVSMKDLEGILTDGYVGASDSSDETYYLATNDEVTFAVLVILSEDATECASFVGDATLDDDGNLQIDDEESGTSFGCTVTPLDDEGTVFDLDMGDLGTAKIKAADVSDVLEAMDTIDAATESVN